MRPKELIVEMKRRSTLFGPWEEHIEGRLRLPLLKGLVDEV